MNRTSLHIVASDSRFRAEVARITFTLGHHAEVYADLDELLDRAPNEGIVIAVDESGNATAQDLLRRLAKRGLWLPVVMASHDPELEQVVSAIKAGALDFLRLPLEVSTFARRLAGILTEACQDAGGRRRQIEAQQKIAKLSPREREALELLSAGCSNKEIAQNLGISPRTVEVHRGKMMTKLRAGHAADAVRLWIEAQIGLPAPSSGEKSVGIPGISGGIGRRAGSEHLHSVQRRAS